jgi:type II secretory ATPase GspE/PulE/Tfp pilus assembly ATPase PilB-like protein
MWVEPFLLASAMKMIISQRLWKKICQECKEPIEIKDIQRKKINEILSPIIDKSELENVQFYKWKWCPKCWYSWYNWRMWFHEILIVW